MPVHIVAAAAALLQLLALVSGAGRHQHGSLLSPNQLQQCLAAFASPPRHFLGKAGEAATACRKRAALVSHRHTPFADRNTAITDWTPRKRGVFVALRGAGRTIGVQARARPVVADPDVRTPVNTSRSKSSPRSRVKPLPRRRRRTAAKVAGATTGLRIILKWSRQPVRFAEQLLRSAWPVRIVSDVLLSTLASASPLLASIIVGAAVCVSCAAAGEHWQQAARVTVEVAILRYLHCLPCGLGVAAELREHTCARQLQPLAGAALHYAGQRGCALAVAAAARRVRLNLFEANALLLGASHVGNACAGSRLWCLDLSGAADAAVGYQLRGFFCRTRGVFGARRVLSLPFDCVDTVLGCQGILSATERELACATSAVGEAFRAWAGAPLSVLDAHSLGTLGARNLKGMGLVAAPVRLFARPFVSLGWTHGTSSICMVGDPICGSFLAKLLDPTCCLLPGSGHIYSKYLTSWAAATAGSLGA